MNHYKSKDFEKMLFPIFDLEPEVDLLEHFDQLKTLPAFQAQKNCPVNHNLIIRYVLFCYDKRSKLQDIPDLLKRKEEALKLAGFQRIGKEAKMLLGNQFIHVCEMISYFCRMQNDRLFQMKTAALEAFYEYQIIIIEPIDKKLDDDKMIRAANLKTKLIEDCDLIHNKIKKYDAELYGSEEDAVDMEAQAQGISPENISKMTI